MKMAYDYDYYKDIENIYNAKVGWNKATTDEERKRQNEIATAARQNLVANGYKDIANQLSASGADATVARQIMEKYAPKTTTTTPTTTTTTTTKSPVETNNLKSNEINRENAGLFDKYNQSYDDLVKTNPFETDTAKAILAKYDLAGLQGRDNVVASGGASNGGNIDSYAAANAMRQQSTLVNQGQMTVLKAHQQKIDNIRGILSDMGVNIDRVFNQDETAKNNDVARKSEIASVTGYVPTEWTYDSNIYLNKDGTVRDEYLTDEFDATGGFTTIINNAKAKLATTTDATEKAQLEATIRAATQAKALKTFSSPKYSKYAHEVENVQNPRTADYDLTQQQMESAERVSLGQSAASAAAAQAEADAEYQKAYLNYMGDVYTADKKYEKDKADDEKKKTEQEEKEKKAMTEDKVKGWVDYLNNEVAAEFGADKVALKEKGKNQYERGDIDADYIIMAVLKSTDLTDAQKKYLLIDKFGISEDEINTVLNDPHYK